MDLSMRWLTDYVAADMPIKEFADGMTMSGSKVEKWRELSEPLDKVVVGKVLAIEKHTNSDKLFVAHVDVGQDDHVQIVTGADNVFDGAYIPVVLDGGTVLNRADGTVTKIKKGKLRGVESCGMMCSFEELGLTESDFPYASKDGILILNDDPDFEDIRIGMDVCEFVGLKDTVVEFEITNNRPDCLSVIGLAREAHATFNLPIEITKPRFVGKAGGIDLSVEVRNTQLCNRYMAAVVKNVKIGPSPRWLAARLRASGVRPINNFVDITNFVMLEYGHPMHAFDKRYVDGDTIIIRNAEQGERITLLDGSEQQLDPSILVIADAKKPIAVAGVMGGEFSGIMSDTETVVFESACFDGVSVRRAAKKMGRRTESSSRFEKGIDPINAHDALYRALELVELLGCGDVMLEVIDVDNTNYEPKRMKLNPTRINTLLGATIHETEQVNILKKLGFQYDDGYVIPPHVRIDIKDECDLAEEIARIYGYNEIKSTVPKLASQGTISKEEVFQRKVEQIVTAQGCYGCTTFSFISPKSYARAGVDESERDSVVIRNPLGETMSVMRSSMLPSMIEVIQRNWNNRVPEGRFYEIGRIYLPNSKSDDPDYQLPTEEKVLCIGLYGEGEDFFSLKGISEELFEKLGLSNIRYTALRSNKSYHTGRCAEVTIDGTIIGVIGELHPNVATSYKIGTRTYFAEFNLERLMKFVGASPKFKSLPRFPATTRDLSLVCDESVSSGEIEEIIQKAGKHIETLEFFDIYTGSQVPNGKKSLSYKLTLRKSDATLTDEEADASVAKILKALAEKDINLRK